MPNILPTDINNTPTYGYDLNEQINKSGMYQWDPDSMTWVRFEGISLNAENINIDLTSTNALLEDLIEAVQAGTTPPAKRLDDSADPVLYLGEAAPGTAENASAWRIQKIDMTSGLTITWAGGSAAYVNRWDQRLSLSYN